MARVVNSKLKELSAQELFQKVGEICSAVNTVVSAKELLDASLKKTMALFGAKRGSIYILNENNHNLTLKIATGLKSAEQKDMVKRLGEGIVGRVAQLKKPVFVENISKDSRFHNYKARKSYASVSFICAPLLVKDKLIGVINITDKENGSVFSENELQLLDFISTQIALNYRRVQLYQKFKKVVKESKSLKNELGKSSKEARELKSKVVQHEKLATIGKLAGGIAHEFNNPLDGVLRYTNLSLENVKDDEVTRGYLLEVKHGLNRMANIVKSLLACSRNETPSRKKIDPNSAIEQALTSIHSEIYQKNIEVEKNLTKNLPGITDYGLERAVSNLLRNAVYAVEEDGKISISSKTVDGYLVIEVEDDGCGMSKDTQEKIFEPFYTTKDIEKGCGLGLTIVIEVLKNYNADIDVQSKIKKGTKFTITIPLDFSA